MSLPTVEQTTIPTPILWARSAEGDIRDALSLLLDAFGAFKAGDHPAFRLQLINAGELIARSEKSLMEALR